MNSKNGRVNHDFQLAYFLAGSCHTPDGAYALLCDLRQDRKDALALVRSSRLREQAKRLRAEDALTSPDPATRLEAEADLAEMDAHAETLALNIAAAEAELATINALIDRIQPHRRFAHLPDAEAHEAAQADEWRLELMRRAENYLITLQPIPADHFNAMRMHPAFKEHIAPHIELVRDAVEQWSRGNQVSIPSLPTVAALLEAKP